MTQQTFAKCLPSAPYQLRGVHSAPSLPAAGVMPRANPCPSLGLSVIMKYGF